MASVSLKQVKKSFGPVTVIDDLSVDIEDGEFMVLVGPSGCGKSTILRLIAGLEAVTAGTISIGTQIVNEIPAKNRDVAMVFQNYALYPHMDVYHNMAFALRMRRMSANDIDLRVRKTAEILELTDLLKRKPRELSGGQSQRVALGRAIVRQPKVFLFDEPLSNLDAKLRVQMRSEIGRLHERLKTTIIYVTHDQTEAMTLGNRLTILLDGKVQQIATPLEAYRQPRTDFVAGFIGSPPMNFIKGFVQWRPREAQITAAAMSFHLELKAAPTGDTAEQRIRIGFRPEDMVPTAAAVNPEKNTFCLDAIIDLIENTGAEQFLHLIVEPALERIIARVPSSDHFRVGQRQRMTVLPHAIRMFDEASGAAIALSIP